MKNNIIFISFIDDKMINEFILQFETFLEIYTEKNAYYFLGVTATASKKIDKILSAEQKERIEIVVIDSFLSHLLINKSTPKHINSVFPKARFYIKDIFAEKINKISKSFKTTLIYLDADILFFNKVPLKYLTSNNNFIFNIGFSKAYLGTDTSGKNHLEAIEDWKKLPFHKRTFDYYSNLDIANEERIKIDKIINRYLEIEMFTRNHVNSGVIVINDLDKYNEIIERINSTSVNLVNIFRDQVLINCFNFGNYLVTEDKSMNYGFVTVGETKDILKILDNTKKMPVFMHFKHKNKYWMNIVWNNRMIFGDEKIMWINSEKDINKQIKKISRNKGWKL